MKFEWPHVRHNIPAIVTASVACCVLLAAWYRLFLDTWLEGIGRNRAWFEGSGVSLALQCGTAVLAATLIAFTISGFTQMTGAITAPRAMKVAVALWLGCVLPTRAIQTVFELRSYGQFALNAGFWLVAMVAMGAIIGAWGKAGTKQKKQG